MTSAGAQSAASVRAPMARRVGASSVLRRPNASLSLGSRRIALGLGIAALALVGGVGAFGGLTGHSAVGASAFSATFAPAASAAAAPAVGSAAGDTWGAGMTAGSIDLFDLAWKGLLVLALLFVTLRVLSRVQGAGQPRRGNLNVLESKQLASKASLHLVAVGDRRLVVGLTPAGMVALTELGAEELPAEMPVVPAGQPAVTSVAGILPQSLAGLFRPATATVDSFSGRLAAAMHRSAGR